jgi:hypothetical protein
MESLEQEFVMYNLMAMVAFHNEHVPQDVVSSHVKWRWWLFDI